MGFFFQTRANLIKEVYLNNVDTLKTKTKSFLHHPFLLSRSKKSRNLSLYKLLSRPSSVQDVISLLSRKRDYLLPFQHVFFWIQEKY